MGNRVLINNTVNVARHVDILEDDIKCTRFKDKEEINEVVGEDETAKVKAEERLKNIKKITAHKEECGLRRSGRGKNSLP